MLNVLKIQPILFEWDTQKNAENWQKHGVSLDDVQEFDWSEAVIIEDTRKDYGEVRYNAYGYHSNGRPMALCFTPRDSKIRCISYRPMNTRECEKFLQI